ncbi:MAG: trehalose-phosphatase [Sulfobacillus thermosulfidooxidans]|nr:MAG: trehalose-phosphatase [Sulfobacillus thermosulfidooxidans]
MSKPLFSEFTLHRLVCDRHIQSCVWFMDIDGTLLDLAPSPDRVHVPESLLWALGQIAQSPQHRIALISGRALSDIQQRFAPLPLIFSGNHGAEYQAGPEHWTHENVQAFGRHHDAIAKALAPLRQEFSGLLIEDKTYSFSVHYRQVAAAEGPAVARRVREAMTGIEAIEIVPAKLCWEIRPKPGPTKADAVHVLWQRVQAILPSPTLAVVIGDDRTDEDAFAALPSAVTIHVGDGPTTAQWTLPSPAAVRALLQHTAQHLTTFFSC